MHRSSDSPQRGPPLRPFAVRIPTVSYLDDPRVFLAAERTLLAWQRTALALMGFGFVVERFGLFLHMVVGQALTAAQRGFSLWLGVGMTLLGGALCVASALQFRTVIHSLGEAEIPRGYWTGCGVWLGFGLAVIALALAIYFVLSAV